MRQLAASSRFALLLAAILSAAGAVASATPAGAALPAGGARYAKVRHVCAAPTPRRASCLALALAPSRPGAAGASLAQAGAGAVSAGPAGGLTPADLAGAYGFSPAIGGSGQTLAIVDAFDDPTLEEDLAAFDAQYGLPACTAGNGCLEKVGQTGSASELPAADTRGWSVEITLDVESAHSVCPNCRILLVEASSRNLRGPRLGGQRGGRAGRRGDLQLIRRLRGCLRRGRNGRLRSPGHRDHRRIGRLGLPQLGFRVRSRRRAGPPRRPRRAAHGRVRGGHDAEAEGKRRAQERDGVERHRATQPRRTETDRGQRGRVQHAVHSTRMAAEPPRASARRDAGPRGWTTTSRPTATRSRALTSTTRTSTNRASPAAGSR